MPNAAQMQQDTLHRHLAIYNTWTLWPLQQPASAVWVVCNAVYDQSVGHFICVESDLILLCELWLEALLQFLFSFRYPLVALYLPLDPLSCPQDLALQIETATLLWVIQVKQSFESLCDCFQLNVSHLSWPHIQDLAGLIHGDV